MIVTSHLNSFHNSILETALMGAANKCKHNLEKACKIVFYSLLNFYCFKLIFSLGGRKNIL